VDGVLGAVIEYNFAEEKEFDVFKMTSHYYLCQVEEEFSAQKLDGYENELGFRPVWVDLDDSIATNRLLLNADKISE
jgi:hypothetical protein